MKTLPRFFFLGLLLCQTVIAENFESFINRRLDEGRLHLPNLLEGGIYKQENVDRNQAEVAELLQFYKNQLGLKDGDVFMSEKLAPIFRMIQGRPVRALYNDSLLWVMRDKKPLYLLRPVDTVTGCDSSCAPIVFHLVMDTKGKVSRILEEADEPLRKIYHNPMSEEDKERLLQILKKLPEAYRGIDHPDRLTNSFTAFPPQTWTFFAPTVVEGAAYTSYRVYESALQVQQRLANKDNEIDILTDLYGRLFRIENAELAKEFLNEITSSSLEKRMGPNTQNFAASSFYEVIAYLAQENLLKATDLKGWLRRRNNRKNEMHHQCSLIRDLLSWPELAKTAVEHSAHCPQDVKGLYQDLLSGKHWETQGHQTPPLLLKDEKTFFYFLNRFLSEKKDSAITQRMLAEARIFFPDEVQAKNIAAPTSEDADRFLQEAELNYREALKRKDLNPWTEESPKGTFQTSAKSTKELPLPKSSIIVFFAPWCPHCQKMLHAWGAQKALDPRLADKILLVQSFASDESWPTAQKFCRDAGLSSTLCKKQLWLLKKEKSQPFIKSLGLFTIPRILITDPNGQILVFNHEIDLNRPLKSSQDLLYLWQEANKARNP